MLKYLYSGFVILLVSHHAIAQDSTKALGGVTITGYRTVNGVGHMLDIKDGIIYAGKKNEVIIVDSLDANKAIGNTRQILGRVPGLNIVETESSGFTANGIATRGLNPTQSIEMNTRQNGYNISADVYGYNEAYYLPPMEAVSRVELVRGAASLQFGAQFGGLVNYVINEPPKDKPAEFNTSFTLGSFGLFNSFNSFGGTYKKWSYYGFLQYRGMQGYRPNSQQEQLSGYGKVQYQASEKVIVGLEYSMLRNRIQMPGGLTDSMFNADPKMSTRARNWLKSPWNIVAGYVDFKPSEKTTVRLQSSYLFSNRSLVWRNEDGGPGQLDLPDSTGQYVSREVESEDMRSLTNELRISHNYSLGANTSTLAGGVRQSIAWFNQRGGGTGTTGSDFDLSTTGPWGYAFDFSTMNIAPFAENIFRLGKKFTVTPGIRIEYLRTTANGYMTEDAEKLTLDKAHARYIPLAGVGMEYKPTHTTSIYGNISQAYRPVDYSMLEPFGVTSKVDSNLKDSYGFNSDLGYRGTVKNYLNFDVSLFYLAYNNRIGLDTTTNGISLRKNIGNSVHKGVESYVEFNALKFARPSSRYGISIFNSFAYVDARYTSGKYSGNRVEAAAKTIERVGVIVSGPRFSATYQLSYVGDAYGDATNVMVSTNPVAGYIPAYTVMDLSATYKVKNYAIKAGVNNLADKAYFTRRTDEYPGPGIIPAIGRSFYVGMSAKL